MYMYVYDNGVCAKYFSMHYVLCQVVKSSGSSRRSASIPVTIR